ncbi:MAG: Lrp/AsnC family transcriptional regulator [Dehalococcoidia bacterium]
MGVGGGFVEQLDEIDRRIIHELKQDASISSEVLAKRLYMSARTVRSRIEKLRNDGVIEFTVRINRHKAGYPAVADILVQVETSKVMEVAEQLARFPEVGYVAITTGSQDVGIQISAPSTDEIHRFVMEKLVALPGVIRSDTHVLFRIIKNSGFSPLTFLEAERVLSSG